MNNIAKPPPGPFRFTLRCPPPEIGLVGGGVVCVKRTVTNSRNAALDGRYGARIRNETNGVGNKRFENGDDGFVKFGPATTVPEYEIVPPKRNSSAYTAPPRPRQ